MKVITNPELKIIIIDYDPELILIKASLLHVRDNLFYGIITFHYVNYLVTYSGHFTPDFFAAIHKIKLVSVMANLFENDN